MLRPLRETLRKLPFGDLYRHLREFVIYVNPSGKTPYGFKFVGTKRVVSGRFEPDVAALIVNEIKAGARTFIDVGAHHGFFTILASHYGATTYSFEPDALNYRVLRRNIKLNRIQTSNIQNIGLSNFEGRVSLFGFATGVSLTSDWSGNKSKRKFDIDVSNIDRCFLGNNLEGNTVIKIDVEGHEWEVLDGARNFLVSRNDITIICEITFREKQLDNGNISSKALETIQSLILRGFEIFTITTEGQLVPLSMIRIADLANENRLGIATNLVFKQNSAFLK